MPTNPHVNIDRMCHPINERSITNALHLFPFIISRERVIASFALSSGSSASMYGSMRYEYVLIIPGITNSIVQKNRYMLLSSIAPTFLPYLGVKPRSSAEMFVFSVLVFSIKNA